MTSPSQLKPEVAQYLRDTNMTADKYERIFDLRYSTILVPRKTYNDDSDDSDDNDGNNGDNDGDNDINNSNHNIKVESKSLPSSSSTVSCKFLRKTKFLGANPAPEGVDEHDGGDEEDVKDEGRDDISDEHDTRRSRQKRKLISDPRSIINKHHHYHALEHEHNHCHDHDHNVKETARPRKKLAIVQPAATATATMATSMEADLELADSTEGGTSDDSFYDASEQLSDNPVAPSAQSLSSPSSSASSSSPPSSLSSSSSLSLVVPRKKHWDVATPAPLLQQRAPFVAAGNVTAGVTGTSIGAIGADTTPLLAIFKHPAEPMALQRARTIESTPTVHFNRPFYCSVSSVASSTTTSSSSSSSQSSVSTWISDDVKWTERDWDDLNLIYTAMDGGDMASEADLDRIADQFLRKHRRLPGDKPNWSKLAIRDRCKALYRVGKKNAAQRTADWCSSIGVDGSVKAPVVHHAPVITPPPFLTPRKFQGSVMPNHHKMYDRSSSSPYPSQHWRHQQQRQSNSSSSRRSVSPTPSVSHSEVSSSSYAPSTLTSEQRRQQRKRAQARLLEKNEQEKSYGFHMKSVFKPILAPGLKTVRGLIPFWKEVEVGKSVIKEEIVVPLMRTPKVRTMVESFESLDGEDYDDVGSEAGGGGSGGGGAAASGTESWNSSRSSISQSASVVSKADLLAQGYARRVQQSAPNDAVVVQPRHTGLKL